MQESCCTLSAHRLHICPNQGLFCARFAQPAFLCIKRRNFRRTRLSSILCVRLRPSAGWLQGSPYQRFLWLPAFYFAGSGMLPGSNLGNRSWLRFSRSTPAGVCRNSTCSHGNFSKKTEGWTVPALLTEPNIKDSEIFSKN